MHRKNSPMNRATPMWSSDAAVGWMSAGWRGMRQPGIAIQNGRFELPAAQIMSQCFAGGCDTTAPSASNCSALLPQSGHEPGDPQISLACQMLLAVRAPDRQPHLTGMVGSPRQGGEQ
jgi:hypothetical protein